MKMLFFLSSVLFLSLGHFGKILRWELFIEIYEKPNRKNLLLALSAGNALSILLPFKLGEVLRAIISGRKMKNGIGFSLATVVMDRYLDILLMGFIFLVIFLSTMSIESILSVMVYFLVSVTLLVSTIIALNNSGITKKIIKKTASIFNSNIKLSIYFFFWSFISSFKNVFGRIHKRKLFGLTIFSWGAYIVSYLFFVQFLKGINIETSLLDIFHMLYAAGTYQTSLLMFFVKNSNNVFQDPTFYFMFYSVVSLFCILLFAVLFNKNREQNVRNILLPYMNEKDMDNFFELYFSVDNSRSLRGGGVNDFLTFNNDVYIIRDLSAGSNATTLLCTKEDKMFYRKYCFGNDSLKLKEQIDWLERYSENISVANILEKKYQVENLYCSYDMPYSQEANNFFTFIHSEPFALSSSLLLRVLDDLRNSIHTLDLETSDQAKIKMYYDEKVAKNLEKILSARELKEISSCKELVINGIVYKNLTMLKKYLSFKYLTDVFKNDPVSTIHGDLTIENIISLKNKEMLSYYLIDPNTGNLHESPFLDLAKLLQSLHGNYEFFEKVTDIKISDNEVSFVNSNSYQYKALFEFYVDYLKKHYTLNELRSIFFHEIVHWLRLIPYKMNVSKKKALTFYAAFIIVLNDVIDRYGDIDDR